MSTLIKREDFTEMVELWSNNHDKKVGVFQRLECEEHGIEWSYTDEYGTDICIECVKEMCEPKVEYTMPGFENLEDSLDKLTIRRTS